MKPAPKPAEHSDPRALRPREARPAAAPAAEPHPAGICGGRAWYELEIEPESDTVQAKVVRLAGSGKRVLELGCATGYMSRALRDRGSSVVAIEIDPKMAEEAGAFCERVIVGDLDTMDFDRELGAEPFDVIVAADVLEHLKQPLDVLARLRTHLARDGWVVACVPNVAHGSVRLALLGGRFPYGEHGLLDHTHLRFFTRETVEKLFESAGFGIGRIERQELALDASEVEWDAANAPPELAEAFGKDPDARTYQFVVVAYPLPRPEWNAIHERFRELRERCEAESRRAADAERELDELRAAEAAGESAVELAKKLADSAARERDLRAGLLEVHAELVRRDDDVTSLRGVQLELGAADARVAAQEREIEGLRSEIEELRADAERLRAALEERGREAERSVEEAARRAAEAERRAHELSHELSRSGEAHASRLADSERIARDQERRLAELAALARDQEARLERFRQSALGRLFRVAGGSR